MRNLPEARVARLAECHKKQKAGYNQHTSPLTEYRICPHYPSVWEFALALQIVSVFVLVL
jgi:hypothetical protein